MSVKNTIPSAWLLGIFLFCIITDRPIFAQDPNPEAIRLISYNIWYDNPDREGHLWNDRKMDIREFMFFYDVDIACLQEAFSHQVEDLKGKTFNHFGVGRDDGVNKGEFTAILYNPDKFALEEGGNFWLSESPDSSGSIGWDAALTRMATWVKLLHKDSGNEFYVFNTHFDHIGKNARLKSAELLHNRITEISGTDSVLAVGDFNFLPGSLPYIVMTGNQGERVLADARSLVQPNDKDPGFSYMGDDFEGEEGDIIDHIFVGQSIQVLRSFIVDNCNNKVCPSDHLPVYIEFILPED